MRRGSLMISKFTVEKQAKEMSVANFSIITSTKMVFK